MRKMEKKKSIKFMNLIVLILVILVVAALLIGFRIKGKKQQERIERYQEQSQIENSINKGESLWT